MKTNQIAQTNLNRFDQGRLCPSHLPHVTRRWVRKATRHLCLLWEGFGEEEELKQKRERKFRFQKTRATITMENPSGGERRTILWLRRQFGKPKSLLRGLQKVQELYL